MYVPGHRQRTFHPVAFNLSKMLPQRGLSIPFTHLPTQSFIWTKSELLLFKEWLLVYNKEVGSVQGGIFIFGVEWKRFFRGKILVVLNYWQTGEKIVKAGIFLHHVGNLFSKSRVYMWRVEEKRDVNALDIYLSFIIDGMGHY